MVQCPYCDQPAKKVGGRDVYPHRPDLFPKTFYMCFQCDAYVGCHPGSDRPLGRMANRELRQAKIKAHSAFDYLWRSGEFSRSGAYKWLAAQLGISAKDCHIGMFDVNLCRRVVEICDPPF